MEKHNKDIVVIPMTDDSPEITFDKKNWVIKISGPSFPEDSVEFYRQILDWIDNHENLFTQLTIEFDYSILSSASNKMVFEIFIKLEKLIEKGKRVLVRWYYYDYDEDMRDEGKSFKASMNVPVELIQKQND